MLILAKLKAAACKDRNYTEVLDIPQQTFSRLSQHYRRVTRNFAWQERFLGLTALG